MDAPASQAERAARAQRGAGLLERLADDAGGRRLAWCILLVLLAAYSISFAAFYPKGVTNDDEAHYLRQTYHLLEGRSTVTQIEPLSGEASQEVLSTYPLGVAFSARGTHDG